MLDLSMTFFELKVFFYYQSVAKTDDCGDQVVFAELVSELDLTLVFVGICSCNNRNSNT